jgi:DNA-binding response OmpR family regulator
VTRKKVLIVDGLRALLAKEEGILSRQDFLLFTANSGGEALSLHRKEKVDLIITGLSMEDMDGEAFCTAIRDDKDLNRVSIIIVCANSRAEIERSSKCKANACVTRPIEPLKLLTEVGRLLDIQGRKSYRVVLKVTVDGRSGTASFFCSSRNISASGILIETERSLEKGGKITCAFFLPKSEHIVAEGEIMRVVPIAGNTFQYGIRYIDLRPDHRSAIEEFVRKYAAGTPRDATA